MIRSKEQNATRKLVELIRGQGGFPSSPLPSQASPTEAPERLKPKAVFSSRAVKHLSCGVFFYPQGICLTLASLQGTTPTLVQWQNIPFPEETTPETPDLPNFLGSCLNRFLKGNKKIPVWTAIEASHLTLKHLTVPDLPLAKMSHAAYWGLKKEANIDEATQVIDFQILDTVEENGIKKKQLLAFGASSEQVAKLKKTFAKAGFSLAGITAIPFAAQNIIRSGLALPKHDYFAVVSIGSDNVEVFCFSKKGLILTRSLRSGTAALTEDLDIPPETDPVDFLSRMADEPVERLTGFEDTSERLIGKIMRTGDYCAQQYTGNTPMGAYFFLGDTDLCKPFMALAGRMIPAETRVFDPERHTRAETMAEHLPQSAGERRRVLTSFAIALSTRAITPDFLFTHQDLQKKKARQTITLATAAAGLFVLCIFAGFHLYLNTAVAKTNKQLISITAAQKKFSDLLPEPDMSSHISKRAKYLAQRLAYIDVFRPLAVINEICTKTPGHIRLIHLDLEMEKEDKGSGNKTPLKEYLGNKKPPKKNSGNKTPPEETGTPCLRIQGQVTGPLPLLDERLGEYLLSLSTSPMFDKIIRIDQKAPEALETGSLYQMQFNVRLEVE